MKHLIIAFILTLAGLASQAHAQERDDSTEAASADVLECNGSCASMVRRNQSFVQKSPESSMQEADYIYGRLPEGANSPSTGK